MIKVSIIIPVYKVEKYIERCLRSVMAQTYDGPMECIVVNDYTPDRSMEIAKQLLTSYIGNICFKIVLHDQNRGLSAARNTGIREARGKYLYFLDSDDEITPDAMVLFIALSERYPQAEVIQGNLYVTYLMKFLLIPDVLPEYIDEVGKLRKMLLKSSVLPMTAWNKMIRKDFLIQNSLWFEEGIVHEDYLWNFLIARCISAIAVCHKPTYVYYWNEGSIMGKVSRHRTDSMVKMLEIVFRKIPKGYVLSGYKNGMRLSYTLLCQLLHIQDRSYVGEKVDRMRILFGKSCKETILHMHMMSFFYLFFFYNALLLYKWCWPFLKKQE